jgi:hypothetical protein
MMDVVIIQPVPDMISLSFGDYGFLAMRKPGFLLASGVGSSANEDLEVRNRIRHPRFFRVCL